jgi:perosamine synthetase
VIEEFEEKFANFVGRKFGVAVSNGSVALELAFEALDLPEGSEVIIPSFAIVSCLAPVLKSKLIPVFIDSDLVTWNVELDNVYRAVSPKTKAILMVHTYGLGVPLYDLERFCRDRKIYLIEDAAEAHGVEIQGGKAGSFGDISTFSFYANKLITTGEGGMVLTNDESISSRLRVLRNLAFKRETRFVHDELGHNYRLSSMQAALGISQLEKISEIVMHRKLIAKTYMSCLKHQYLYSFQPLATEFSENVYWVVGVLLNDRIGKYKDEIISRLNSCGVQTRPFFYPLHLQPLLGKYEGLPTYNLDKSLKLYENGFYLPSGNGYEIKEIHSISLIFNEIMAELILENDIE